MTDILIPKKNLIFDATIFTSLQTCGRLLDLRFNHDLQLISGKANALECGSLVHHILEHYNKGIIGGMSRANAIEHGFKAGYLYIKNGEDGTGLKNTPAESEKKPRRTGYNFVLKRMEQYFDYYKNDHWIPLESEVVKGKVIYEDDEIRILWKAKFDVIYDTNTGIYPADHKTRSMNKDIVSLNNQFIGQCVLMEVRNVIINNIGFQESLPLNEVFQRVMVPYSISRLAEWVNVIVPYWAKIYLTYLESGYFPPNFHSCEHKFGFCVFKEVCEVDEGMRTEELALKFYKGKKWDISNSGEDTL